jgi:hypothetical protein
MGNNNPNILDLRFIIGGPCVDYGWRCSYSYGFKKIGNYLWEMLFYIIYKALLIVCLIHV